MRFVLYLVPAAVLLAACASSLSESCPSGTASLDGTCVNQQIADYVGCIRAKGTNIGHERGDKLSAEARYAGAEAGTVAEVNERLDKKFQGTSEANESAIIADCYRLVNGAAAPAPAAPNTGATAPDESVAPEATSEAPTTGSAAPSASAAPTAAPAPSEESPAPPDPAQPSPPKPEPGVDLDVKVDTPVLPAPR